jgi:hypothetical protein
VTAPDPAQVAAVGAALVTALQSERAAAGRGGGGEAADTLAGLLARLASGADAGDRAALALVDMQSRADGLFLGFLFLGTLDLLLLWLLGAGEAAGRAPRGMQRLHSSAASDLDLSKQGSAVRDLQLAMTASAATLSPRAPHPPGQQLA